MAPTKILVCQQKTYIEKNSDARTIDVTGETQIVGGRSKSFWHLTGWEEVLCLYEVVVMTPQVLCHILEKRLFDSKYIDTLVIDECHHANRNNPIATICRIVKDRGSNPLILSMTASPVKCKKDPVVAQIKALEDVLNCRMLCTREIIEEYRRSAPVASLGVFRYQTGATGMMSWLVNVANGMGNKDRGFPSRFDLSQSVRKINFPKTFSLQQNPSCLLLHAYFRMKNSLSIKTIFGVLNTMMADPTSMPELSRVSLPKTVDYKNYLRGIPLPSSSKEYSEPAFQPIPHVLKPDYASLQELADVVQAMGQVVSIVEECGVVSALYAFILSLEDTLMEKTYAEATKKGIDGKKFSKNVRTSKVIKSFKDRRSKTLSYSDRETQSNIDPEKIGYQAKDLSASSFNPIDLFHDQYVACVSMLDFFFAFGAGLGPEICKRASMTFALSCKKIKKPTLVYMIHIEDDDYYTSGVYPVGRMNAVIWMLLKRLSDPDRKEAFDLTTEGCLQSLQAEIHANPIFNSFELRVDVCCNAVRRACWFLLQALSVKDLEKWASIDHDFQCGSFEPLLVSPEKPTESLPDHVNDWFAHRDLTQLEFVSAKVKAICLLWKRINQVDDFALQWILGQQEMLTTMEQKQKESVVADALAAAQAMRMDGSPSCEGESTKYDIPTAVATGGDPINDASFIVFCQRRLTTRSLHFVLTMMLENKVSMPSDLVDFATYEEDGDDETLNSVEVLADVKSILSELGRIVEVIAGHDNRIKRHHGNRIVQDIVGDMVDQVEERVLGRYEAQKSRYILKLRHYKANQLIKLPAFRPVHLVGGMKQKTQVETLAKFKVSEYNVVFATDVVEEGLDVKACKYVINFDLPFNVKSFIQRKGRSRASNSMFISLIPYGDIGTRMIEKLQFLLYQEHTVEHYAADGRHKSILMEFEELVPDTNIKVSISALEDGIVSQSEQELSPLAYYDVDDMLGDMLHTTVRTLNCGSSNSMDVSSGDEADEEKDEHEKSTLPDTSSFAVFDDEFDEKYVIEATGAEVSGRSAVQTLIMFCKQLPHDMVFSFNPIFYMEKVLVPVSPERNDHKYRCSILLPIYVDPAIRFLLGPLCRTKVGAKRLAALTAVRVLHQRGELDDWLLTKGSTQSIKKEKAMLNAKVMKEGGIESMQNAAPTKMKLSAQKKLKMKVVNSSKASKEEKEEQADGNLETSKEPMFSLNDEEVAGSNMIKILVKVIPDTITLPARINYEDCRRYTRLYLYCSYSEFVNSRSREIVLNCVGCVGHFAGLNNVCMAFTRPIHDEILDCPFRCQIREDEAVRVGLSFVGSKDVDDRELFHMQRFHRGVLCWETEDLHALLGKQVNWDQFSDDLWIHPSTKLYNIDDAVQPIEHDVWRQSSGGSWYLLFPCPLIPGFDIHEPTMVLPAPAEKAAEFRKHILSEEWLSFLMRSADEAQIMCHNFRVQDFLNRTKLSNPYQCEVRNENQMVNFVGMVCSRGPGSVFYVHRDNIKPNECEVDTNVKRMTTVMKYILDPVKVEVDNVIKVLVALVETSNKLEDTESQGVLDAACSVLPPPTLKRKVSWEEPGKVVKAQRTDNAQASRFASQNEKQASVPIEPQRFYPKEAKDFKLLKGITYADNTILKHPECIPSIDLWKSNPQHRLAKVVPISSVLTLSNFIGKFIMHLKRHLAVIEKFNSYLPVNPNSRRIWKVQKAHRHSYAIYLPLEIIRPLGRHLWMLVGLTAPTVAWRVQSYYLALETRQLLTRAASKIERPLRTHLPVDSMEIALETCSSEEAVASIPLSLILESVTPRLGREILDYERLEFLGDIILKFIITIELFRVFPKKHEGFLTAERGKYIGNHFLIDVAHKTELQKYIRALPLCNGRHNLSTRPAGMLFEAIVNDRSMWSANIMLGSIIAKKEAEREGMEKEVREQGEDGIEDEELKPFQHLDNATDAKQFSSAKEYFQHLYTYKNFHSVSINPKVVADIIEAIIGACYVHGGVELAMIIIKALDAWPKVAPTAIDKDSETAMNNTLILNKFKTKEFVKVYCRAEDLVFPPNYPVQLQRIALGRIKMTENMLDREQNLVLPEDDVDMQTETNKKQVILHTPWLVEDTEKAIDELALVLGYRFTDWSILEEALTHCSIQTKVSNQRLEFLGDAVLDLVVVSLLYTHETWATQGDLSFQKSSITNNINLGVVASKLQLYRFLRHASMNMEAEFRRVHDAICQLMRDIDISTEETFGTNTDLTNPSSGAEGKVSATILPPGPTKPSAVSKTNTDTVELVYFLPCTRESTVDSGVDKPPSSDGGKKRSQKDKKRVVHISHSASKALADMFEAIVGAIFLDSGGDVEPIKSLVRFINLIPQLHVHVDAANI
ncbi:hypothetical protein EON65_07275 [archaeon]|nr:MAG: hypothetical protein EON65_07275 [archaeon]